MAARVVIRRGAERIAMLRRYRILVDGRPAATVGRNETVELTVPAGTHRVEARIDWLSSEPLDIALADGEQVVVECSAHPNPLVLWWYTIRRRKGYLRLRIDDGDVLAAR